MANPQPRLTRYDIWDLNCGNIPGFPVANPPGWDDISLYYAKALKAMGWQQSPAGNTDVTSMWPYSEVPDSYYFQAAMHWWPKYPNDLPSAPYNERWSHCTHPHEQETNEQAALTDQYFLAWQRAYIYYFEVIVRSYVAALGGPPTWALPYWNYSYYDNSDPAAPGAPYVRSNLPWVFSQAQLPDGSDNPLCIADPKKRGLQPVWADVPQSQEQGPMFLDTLTPYYDTAYGSADFPDFNSALENQPHNAVHNDTGTADGHLGGGWMASTVTASFDPVFWLHHSEIDRFWVGWNMHHANPTDPAWLNAQDDPLHETRWNFWSDGNLANQIVVYPGQMLHPGSLGGSFPYSYGYQTIPTYPAPPTPGPALVAQAVPELAARPQATGRAPQTRAAAAAGGVPARLGREPVSAAVPLHAQARAAAAQLTQPHVGTEPPHVILRLEGISSDGPVCNYEIYLNYLQADRRTAGTVPNYVGLLAAFGADHHHQHAQGDDESPHGLSASYDITAIVGYLRTHGGWDEAEARITFVPAVRQRAGLGIQTSELRIARISIETM